MVGPMQERRMEYQRLDRLAPEPVPVPAPAPVILERNQVIEALQQVGIDVRPLVRPT